MARIVIPGGTGYLGRALAGRLAARGDEVVLLTRSPSREADGCRGGDLGCEHPRPVGRRARRG